QAKKNKTNIKTVTLCNDLVREKKVISLDLKNLLYNNKESFENKNSCEYDKTKLDKIKESYNYLIYDYKYKKNIIEKKNVKNAKPAKYLKNMKQGMPIRQFLSSYGD
ncbi:hypothetical protein HEP_00531000, partial [Hepatocystis sp. ex Piliocolobus tephrosceles]